MRELTQATQAIAAGDLSQRVNIRAGDEMGDLAAAFNQMAAELERAESLRRQMTADIAHELRTPLSVIQGNVEALQDGVFPLTIEALEPIQTKTALLSRLVQDLHNLALAEAGQLPLDRQPTELAKLIERIAAAFQPAAEAKSISLELEVRADLSPADVDPQRVEQVLVNLLSNALRHTPAGGAISIELASSGARQLGVRVTDSGPGIPAEALSKVFERFYRVEQGRARSESGQGSGLGLAVARSIVEAHGGSIGVENVPGRGASFWLVLPAAL
jgi:signal transduction histidine kinase